MTSAVADANARDGCHHIHIHIHKHIPVSINNNHFSKIK